jgi:hypothetical protein
VGSSANTIWAGCKYAVNARLDVMGAFYYAWQNNFSTTPCTGQGIHISNSSCAGTLDTLSLLIDYRPVKRVGVYAGVAVERLRGPCERLPANIDPTVGVWIKF